MGEVKNRTSRSTQLCIVAFVAASLFDSDCQAGDIFCFNTNQDPVVSHNYRATHWLDAQMTKTRFFEILDRCVDEAVRGYYQLAH